MRRTTGSSDAGKVDLEIRIFLAGPHPGLADAARGSLPTIMPQMRNPDREIKSSGLLSGSIWNAQEVFLKKKTSPRHFQDHRECATGHCTAAGLSPEVQMPNLGTKLR